MQINGLPPTSPPPSPSVGGPSGSTPALPGFVTNGMQDLFKTMFEKEEDPDDMDPDDAPL